MKLTRSICGALFALLLSAPVGAQDASRIKHTIRSAHPDEERTFAVQLPLSYQSQTAREYPVLYLLDGEANLDYTQTVAEFLAQNGLVPEIIIVALHAGATRNRDYLPKNPAAGPRSGQADQFMDYLDNELVPFVEANYRAAPLRLISGHSAGGVFVTHVMARRPEMFRAYLTQSPFFDQTVGGPVLDRAEEALASTTDLDAFFYMNVGNEPDLEPNFERMEAILVTASSDSFRWSTDRQVGATHMSTRLVGQYAGLALYFAERWPLSEDKLIDGGPSALESHIEALSIEYGYPVLYNEQAFQTATQTLLNRRELPSAIEYARMYAREYPGSPPAHFLLGVALASGGEREQGLEAIETAVKLYEDNPRPDLEPLYENMKVVQQRLGGG